MKVAEITLVVKDGAYEQVKIPIEMLGELAYAIQQKGSEMVRLANGKQVNCLE